MTQGLSSQAENGADTVVDCIDECLRQLACSVDEPLTVDQLQPERHRYRILRQPGDGRLEQNIAGKTGSIQIRSERHDMGLPDVNAKYLR